MLKPKLFGITICMMVLPLSLLAYEVFVAKEDIMFRQSIDNTKLVLTKRTKLPKFCTLILPKDIKESNYIAARFIKKGKVLCKNDIKQHQKNRILFSFGTIEIEKDARVVRDTKEIIVLQRRDGKLERIDKRGVQ